MFSLILLLCCDWYKKIDIIIALNEVDMVS
jgi:hypothetical protein